MTTLQPTSALQVLGTPDRQLRIDGALPLQARRSGWLVVDAGQVWITRSGDMADHVLATGQALHLGRGQQLVAEPWRSGQVARLRWAAGAPADLRAELPAQAPVLRPLPAERPVGAGLAWPAWRFAAWALRGVALRLAAAARSAESRASAAQGRICAGDSMAASGALQ